MISALGWLVGPGATHPGLASHPGQVAGSDHSSSSSSGSSDSSVYLQCTYKYNVTTFYVCCDEKNGWALFI